MNKKEYFTPSVKVVYMATKERLMSMSTGSTNQDPEEDGLHVNSMGEENW